MNIGDLYKSKVNPCGFVYIILKVNKTTCWCQVWDDGKAEGQVFKNVPKRIMKPANIQ